MMNIVRSLRPKLLLQFESSKTPFALPLSFRSFSTLKQILDAGLSPKRVRRFQPDEQISQAKTKVSKNSKTIKSKSKDSKSKDSKTEKSKTQKSKTEESKTKESKTKESKSEKSKTEKPKLGSTETPLVVLKRRRQLKRTALLNRNRNKNEPLKQLLFYPELQEDARVKDIIQESEVEFEKKIINDTIEIAQDSFNKQTNPEMKENLREFIAELQREQDNRRRAEELLDEARYKLSQVGLTGQERIKLAKQISELRKRRRAPLRADMTEEQKRVYLGLKNEQKWRLEMAREDKIDIQTCNTTQMIQYFVMRLNRRYEIQRRQSKRFSSDPFPESQQTVRNMLPHIVGKTLQKLRLLEEPSRMDLMTESFMITYAKELYKQKIEEYSMDEIAYILNLHALITYGYRWKLDAHLTRAVKTASNFVKNNLFTDEATFPLMVSLINALRQNREVVHVDTRQWLAANISLQINQVKDDTQLEDYLIGNHIMLYETVYSISIDPLSSNIEAQTICLVLDFISRRLKEVMPMDSLLSIFAASINTLRNPLVDTPALRESLQELQSYTLTRLIDPVTDMKGIASICRSCIMSYPKFIPLADACVDAAFNFLDLQLKELKQFDRNQEARKIVMINSAYKALNQLPEKEKTEKVIKMQKDLKALYDRIHKNDAEGTEIQTQLDGTDELNQIYIRINQLQAEGKKLEADQLNRKLYEMDRNGTQKGFIGEQEELEDRSEQQLQFMASVVALRGSLWLKILIDIGRSHQLVDSGRIKNVFYILKHLQPSLVSRRITALYDGKLFTGPRVRTTFLKFIFLELKSRELHANIALRELYKGNVDVSCFMRPDNFRGLSSLVSSEGLMVTLYFMRLQTLTDRLRFRSLHRSRRWRELIVKMKKTEPGKTRAIFQHIRSSQALLFMKISLRLKLGMDPMTTFKKYLQIVKTNQDFLVTSHIEYGRLLLKRLLRMRNAPRCSFRNKPHFNPRIHKRLFLLVLNYLLEVGQYAMTKRFFFRLKKMAPREGKIFRFALKRCLLMMSDSSNLELAGVYALQLYKVGSPFSINCMHKLMSQTARRVDQRSNISSFYARTYYKALEVSIKKLKNKGKDIDEMARFNIESMLTLALRRYKSTNSTLFNSFLKNMVENVSRFNSQTLQTATIQAAIVYGVDISGVHKFIDLELLSDDADAVFVKIVANEFQLPPMFNRLLTPTDLFAFLRNNKFLPLYGKDNAIKSISVMNERQMEKILSNNYLEQSPDSLEIDAAIMKRLSELDISRLDMLCFIRFYMNKPRSNSVLSGESLLELTLNYYKRHIKNLYASDHLELLTSCESMNIRNVDYEELLARSAKKEYCFSERKPLKIILDRLDPSRKVPREKADSRRPTNMNPQDAQEIQINLSKLGKLRRKSLS